MTTTEDAIQPELKDQAGKLLGNLVVFLRGSSPLSRLLLRLDAIPPVWS